MSSSLPDRDDFFSLMKDGPRVVEKLTRKRLHKSTLHRWNHDGRHGVKLKTWNVGGERFTTVAALLRFFEEVGEAQSNRSNRRKSPAARRRRARHG